MIASRAPWISLTLLVALLLGVVVVLSPARPRTPVPLTSQVDVPATTDEVRTVVCRRVLVDFADQIARDAPAAEVTGDLATTVAIARAGAARDPALLQLAGGVGALLESLDTDDPGAAAVAVRVVETACDA